MKTIFYIFCRVKVGECSKNINYEKYFHCFILTLPSCGYFKWNVSSLIYDSHDSEWTANELSTRHFGYFIRSTLCELEASGLKYFPFQFLLAFSYFLISIRVELRFEFGSNRPQQSRFSFSPAAGRGVISPLAACPSVTESRLIESPTPSWGSGVAKGIHFLFCYDYFLIFGAHIVITRSLNAQQGMCRKAENFCFAKNGKKEGKLDFFYVVWWYQHIGYEEFFVDFHM